MQKKMAGIFHTITKAEFNYLATKLSGFGPTDIHKMIDLALTKKRTEFFEKLAFKVVHLKEGPHFTPCLENDLQKVSITRETLMKSKCAFKPVTVLDILHIIEEAKPGVKESTTQRYNTFEKNLGSLG